MPTRSGFSQPTLKNGIVTVVFVVLIMNSSFHYIQGSLLLEVSNVCCITPDESRLWQRAAGLCRYEEGLLHE